MKNTVQNILIIGANSAIAEATARVWAIRGCNFALAGRDINRLNATAADLKIRGAKQTACLTFDATQPKEMPALLDQAITELGSIDTILVAHGTLPDQKKCETDLNVALDAIRINAISVIGLLTHAANVFEKRGSGTICVISSVAGDRGRQSNYVYGAAKSMVSTFCDGLRNRLFKSGVAVVLIKPGFVDTPMTAHINPKGALWATPEKLAQIIASAVDNGKNTVYAPWFWLHIMNIIRHIPEFIFKKLSL
jgi:decaprenylphospho-beta-D-erythro-pentofuranosid-2-ulose 2-reductase